MDAIGVPTERPNCKDKGLIEIAAYAYNNSLRPYENEGTLLKKFKTKLRVNEWYGFKLNIFSNNTVYKMYTKEGKKLEQIKIDHRDCGKVALKGEVQSLYFGGKCPAPKPVTLCYVDSILFNNSPTANLLTFN